MLKNNSLSLRSAVVGTFLAAGMAFAQGGLAGGLDGIRQVGANTLGLWNVSFGVGGEAAMDSWALAAGGVMTDSDNHSFSMDERSLSVSAQANLAIGLFNWLDVGVSMPFYMDNATDKDGRLADNGMTDLGWGDLEGWMKIRIVGNDSSVFKLALLGQAYAAIGRDDAGIRPRHSWYLSQDVTRPYTAGTAVVGGGLAFTFDFGRFVRWNGQASFLYALDDEASSAVTYSTGLNLMPTSFVDIFLEASGEFHIDDKVAPIDPGVDPMIAAAGLRFHLTNHVDLALGVEVAPRLFRNLDFDFQKDLDLADEFDVRTEGTDGRVMTYKYASTPLLAGAASLVWRFGSKTKKDLNVDSLVQVRADSLAKVKVDSIMASIDTTTKIVTVSKVDTVSKIDTIAKVDTVATVDTIAKVDTVKVIDTTGNAAKQAMLDSIAAVSDSLSKLAADDDKDGIPNMSDKCPGTLAGLKVGPDGCEVDTDGDGVVDSKDKCAASNAGAPVDADGCEFDEDNDGVVDAKDACPKTLSEASVNAEGCPTNKNEDLTYLQGQVKFKKKSAKFAKGATKALDQVAALMSTRPDLRIEIQGHADDQKNSEKNMDMSEDRAQAVVDYLIKKGVPSKHVRAAGKGDTQLLVQPAPAKKGKKAKKAKSNPKNNRVVFESHVKKPKAAPKAEAAPAAPKAETAPAAANANAPAAPKAEAAAPAAKK